MDPYPNNKRPLSAIFLGNPSTHGALGSLSQIQTQSGFQHSPNNGGSGLPSPPATNSTASTGKESVPKRVRKTSIAFATVKSMLTGDRREQERERERQRRRSEEDDDEPMDDEEHTARLSGPAASTSSGGSLILGRSTSAGARSTTSSGGGMDRVRSLADRNRKVLDKLSSISSAASSRLHSPAPTDRTPLTASTLRSRAVSPMPPISANTLFPPKSNTSATGSSPRGTHLSLTSPNVRHSRDLEPETPSPASRFSPADSNGGSSGKGSDQAQPRPPAPARQTSARDTPRMREIEFTNDYEQPTASRDRERLYQSQRAPPPSFTVSGEGASSGLRREGSVRVSFSRSRHEIDLNEFGVNRNAQQGVYSSEDDRSTTPPADSGRRHVTDPVPPTPATRRERRVSITEPKTSPSKEREPLRTRAAAGTLGRQRNSSEMVIERTVAAARKSPVRPRGALPSEFRNGTESKRASIDNKRMSLDGKRTFSSPRVTNSPEILRRDSGFAARPATAGGTRPATVREPRRIQTHSRWASEDTTVDMNEPGSRPRYERRGGSIESPLTPGGRSVVGETFKAAGLTKRRDVEEPVSPASNRAVDSRDAVDWEVEQLREGIARVGVGDMSIGEEDESEKEDPRTPPAGHNRAASRNIHHIMTSRPGTSSGTYVDDGPRTAPPALRPYRSMGTGLATPSGSGTVRERGATPVTPASLVSTASTEHVRLMLESFAMFESNLARMEGSTSGGNGGSVTELLQNADVVVQASQSLNTILRRAAARALTEQIEAEVEDRTGPEMEIWKAAGGEFRDSLKVSDELVRSMTNLLLGMGRVLKERSGDGDEVRSSGRLSSSELRSGRMSAEGLRAQTSAGNRFPESNRIVEERRNSEVRRSLDGDTLRRIASREYDPLRPQTSMSLLRERGRASPIDNNQTRLASAGASRRFFPPRQSPVPPGDPDASFGTDGYQSPSPATRHLGPNGEHHHRERMLSIPPRLESVPSESIISKTSTKPAPTISRRPRIAAGTIRSTAPFATTAPAPAPTQLSTAVAIGNGSPEKPQRSMSYSVSRSGGATMTAMSGLQAQARKRTISNADPMEPEMESSLDVDSGSGTQRLQSTITRGRASTDFSADESSASGAERKLRRRTATELFR